MQPNPGGGGATLVLLCVLNGSFAIVYQLALRHLRMAAATSQKSAVK